ncbi:MAG: cobalamin-dependent protein [Acidimicrobiales bacterium]
MTAHLVDRDAAQTYLRLIEARDHRAAVAHVIRLLETGFAPGDIIHEVLIPTQRAIGEAWLDGRLSVAEEHAATAITESALGALFARANYPSDRGHVIAACAEGDWHALAPRMLAELLRTRRWRVTLVGASVPASSLAAMAAEAPGTAIALSCSQVENLGGAVRSIAAAHQLGLPTLVGGAAVSAERAALIGADGWARDHHGADEVLSRWRDEGPPPLATTPAMEPYRAVSAVAPGIVADAMEAAGLGPDDDLFPLHRGPLAQSTLMTLVVTAAIAVSIDDETAFTDIGDYARRAWARDDLAPSALAAALAHASSELRPVDRATVDLLATFAP